MSVRLKLPNFFLIGAPKCGTTALYNSLSRHPDIYLPPIKEPHYFTFDGPPPVFPGPAGDYFARVAIHQPRAYATLFAGVTNQTAIGEGSTTYLGSQVAAKRIKQNIPNARIIAILRHPADRAYSQYNFYRFHGVESSLNFLDALTEEPGKIRRGWSFIHFHRQGSYYYHQLCTYYDLFNRNDIHICLYDDLDSHPHRLIESVLEFLHLNQTFTPEVQHCNVTKISNDALGDSSRPPPLDPEIRRQLTAEYREDILKTQDLIGIDLSHWLL